MPEKKSKSNNEHGPKLLILTPQRRLGIHFYLIWYKTSGFFWAKIEI